MTHYQAKMSSKGQVTIPAAVRDLLSLRTGDIVDFYVSEGARSVRVRARNETIGAISGMLNAYVEPGAALTGADVQRSIDAQMAEDDMRVMRENEEWREFQKWRRRVLPAAE